MTEPCRTVSVSISTGRPEEHEKLERYEELVHVDVLAEGCPEQQNPFLEAVQQACTRGSAARYEIAKLEKSFPDHSAEVKKIYGVVSKGTLLRRKLPVIQKENGTQKLRIKVVTIKAAA